MDAKSPKYDQEFFLRLARPADGSLAARREARRRWREWRRDPANADVAVNFEGVDFRTDENRCISFSALEFGGRANFRAARFGEKARFVRARFGERADFTDATFGNVAEFNSASFGNWAKFNNASFGDRAKFNNASFGDGAKFNNASFGNWAKFNNASFGNWADFNNASFGNWAEFNNASFGNWAKFNNASFGNVAKFNNASFGDGATFRASLLQGSADFSGGPLEIWITRERARRVSTFEGEAARKKAEARFDADVAADRFGPHRFLEIDFSDARILGEITFARRDFERPANFTGVQFHVPPDFDGATNPQRIDFTGARVGFTPPDQPRFKPHWTERSSVPLRLRAFRGVAEATKNHDLERDLYIEERKAERGVYWARYAKPLRVRGVPSALAGLSGWTTAKRAFSRKIGTGRRNGRSLKARRDAVARWRLARIRLRRIGRVRETPEAVAKLAIHALWIAVMGAYWALSDYGRSLIRPLVWLAISLPLFIGLFIVDLHDQRSKTAQAAAFSTRAGLGFAAPARADGDANGAWRLAKAQHLAATRQLALANTIPFVGPLSIDADVKKFLLCGVAPDDAEALKKCVPVAPLAYQGVLIGQNVLSALLLFFFGLAMRNYFKVK